MLILKGLGKDRQPGQGVIRYVPICGTSMSITGSSSSSLVGKEVQTTINATSSKVTPSLMTGASLLKSTLSFTSMVPTIRLRSETPETPCEETPECLYTGIAERTVGGINESDVFVDAAVSEMWDALLKQEKFPSLQNPSSTFISTVTGFREIGEVITTIQFTSTFDRGSIDPQYNSDSPYRSGDANNYAYTGSGLISIEKTDLTDIQSITNYTVLANGQSWSNSVDYDSGPQPQSSYDNDYDSPLAAGSTATITHTITGVLPVYANSDNLTNMDSQPLQANGTMIQIDFLAEDGSNKQTVDFPSDVLLDWGPIVRVEYYDTFATAWKTINTTDEASVADFDISTVVHTVQGTVRDYTRYTHNGPTTGARQTRWHTS